MHTGWRWPLFWFHVKRVLDGGDGGKFCEHWPPWQRMFPHSQSGQQSLSAWHFSSSSLHPGGGGGGTAVQVNAAGGGEGPPQSGGDVHVLPLQQCLASGSEWPHARPSFVHRSTDSRRGGPEVGGDGGNSREHCPPIQCTLPHSQSGQQSLSALHLPPTALHAGGGGGGVVLHTYGAGGDGGPPQS